jgi:hypothetical protein
MREQRESGRFDRRQIETGGEGGSKRTGETNHAPIVDHGNLRKPATMVARDWRTGRRERFMSSGFGTLSDMIAAVAPKCQKRRGIATLLRERRSRIRNKEEES